jgi:hypothetical protein
MASTNYFSGGGSDASEEAARWIDWKGSRSVEVVPGLQIQALTSGNVMVSFVRLEPDTEAAVHWHDEEQISIVIDGELEFEAGGVTPDVASRRRGCDPVERAAWSTDHEELMLRARRLLPPAEGPIGRAGDGPRGEAFRRPLVLAASNGR